MGYAGSAKKSSKGNLIVADVDNIYVIIVVNAIWIATFAIAVIKKEIIIYKMKKTYIIALVLFFLFAFTPAVFAHQPQLIFLKQGDVEISNPEISKAFYDELKGQPKNYFITSDKDFELYLNLLVPAFSNPKGRYSAKVFLVKEDLSEEQIVLLDGEQNKWEEYYEEFGRDYYYKGPEITQNVVAGKYRIEISSAENLGKYVLAIGKTEYYGWQELLNVYWQLPLLKIMFFKTSVLQFFLTPFGIGAVGVLGGLIILFFIINYIISLIKTAIKHAEAKTLLLTSGGMPYMKDEIIQLLQKPAYDVTVAFINTASKPEEDTSYVQRDLDIMREMGFNVEEIDLEGKTEAQVLTLLELKDIIYVEGGNTFYLLNAMRKCNFEKVLRKLLKHGKVYIGVSAGSIVAGRTIQTADRFGTGNRERFGVKNLKGLNLVPFDIFVHYTPEFADIIKQKIKNPRKRLKKLRILTDEQAILVQGKEVSLIGEGEQIIV